MSAPRILLVFLIAASLCHRIFAVLASHAQTRKIGVSLGLTGPADRWGRFQRMGIELAAEDLRREGYDIELLLEDSQSKPNHSLSIFNKFAKVDNVDGILGDIFSFITEPLIPLANQQRKLLISPSASRILCSEKSRYFFTTASQVALAGEGYGYFLDRHPEVKRVALVYFQDAGWGHQYRDIWRRLLSDRHVEIVGEFETAEFAPDFKTPLVKLLNAKPDAFFVAQDPTTFIPAAKQLRFGGQIVFANNILEIPAGGAETGAVEGIYFVDTQPSLEFVKRFIDRFNEPPLLEAYNGYEAVRVLNKAIRERPDAPELAVEKLQYDGVSGPMNFRNSCAGNQSRWHLKQFVNKEIVLIQ